MHSDHSAPMPAAAGPATARPRWLPAAVVLLGVGAALAAGFLDQGGAVALALALAAAGLTWRVWNRRAALAVTLLVSAGCWLALGLADRPVLPTLAVMAGGGTLLTLLLGARQPDRRPAASPAASDAIKSAQAQQARVLQTAAEIATAVDEITDTAALLPALAALVRTRFDLYYTAILLTEPPNGPLRLAAEAGVAVVEQSSEPQLFGRSEQLAIARAVREGIIQDEAGHAPGAENPFGFQLPETKFELAIPLRTRGAVIGVLDVQSVDEAGFSAAARSALSTVADLLAGAVDHARVLAQVHDGRVRSNNLFLSSRHIIQAETPAGVYARLIDFAGASGLVDMAALIIPDARAPDRFLYPAYWAGRAAAERDLQPAVEPPHPFAELLPSTKLQIVRLDADQNALGPVSRAFLARLGMTVAALVPIHREEIWLGTLTLLREQDHPFAPPELEPFLMLCNQAAAVLATQQLLGETSTLYRASRSLSQVITREDALELIVSELARHTGADQSRVVIYDYRLGYGRIELEYAPHGGAEKVQFAMTGDFVFERLREDHNPLVIRDDGAEELLAAAYLRPFGAGSALIIPAFSQQELIGFITLEAFNAARAFSATEINFARTLVDQLSTQIENLALFDDALTRAQELITLNQIGALISSTLQIEDLAEVICEQVGRLMDNSIFLLAEYAPETRSYRPLLATRYGERFIAPARRLQSDDPLYQLLHNDRPVTPEMQAPVSRLAGLSDLYVSGWVPESALWITMRREGAPSGLLSVQSYRPHAYDENHLQLLRTIANQAGLALANARLFQRTEEALAEQRTLFDITQAATASPEPRERLQRVAASLGDTFAGAEVAILTVDEDGGRLTQVAGNGRFDAGDQILSLQSGILREAVLRSRPVLVDDLRRLAGYDSNRDALSQLVVPISFGRRTVGIVNVESPTTDAFSESDLRLVQILGPSIAATIESDRLFREIQDANEQLRELDHLKMLFLANMSHELRTPLNSIIGFSRVILKGIDGPINDQQSDDLTAIYNSGQHLLNIINDILDVARIEAGKLDLVFEQVDLARLAERTMDTVRGLVRAEEIALITDVAPDLPLIEADPVRLRQILLNLLSNAAKFTSAGEIRLSIAPREPTYRSAPVSQVVITVSDTGPGIPDEDIDRIFTAFERTDRTVMRADEGTGLGLPITKRLVELHNGAILLESTPSTGTIFTILLPLRQPAPAASEDAGSAAPVTAHAQMANRKEGGSASAL